MGYTQVEILGKHFYEYKPGRLPILYFCFDYGK